MNRPPGQPAAPPTPATSLFPDPGARLPLRLPGRSWLLAIGGLLVSYFFLFLVVHPFVDLRRCVAQLPDPLFGLIPHNPRWYLVSHELYYVVNATGTLTFLVMAWRGDHRPFPRFALGLGLLALFRSVTLTLLPICKSTIPAGTAAITAAELSRLNLGFIEIPYRTWATNDLVFSGHVGEFLLMFWASRSFPWAARLGLVLFQLLQAYALVATRGHYTIDLVIAVPFAFVADRIAVWLLALTTRGTAPPGQVMP